MKFHLVIFSLLISVFYIGQDSIELVNEKIDNFKIQSSEKFFVLDSAISKYRSSNPESALRYAEMQYEVSLDLKVDSLLSIATSNLANVYFQLGDYANCTKNALIAFETSKSIQDIKGQIEMLCLLGRMHVSKEEFPKSYEYYYSAEKIALSSTEETLLLPIYIGLGNAKFMEEKIREAEAYFNKCVTLTEKFPDGKQDTKATIYTNLGNIQSKYKDEIAAIIYYKKALAIYITINDLFDVSLTTYNIGDAYLAAGVFDSSQVYFKKNLAIGQQLNSNEEIYFAYLGLTNLFTKTENYEKALKYQVLTSAYKDSLQKMKYNKTVVEMQKKYEFEQSQKALKIAELEVLKAKDKEIKDKATIENNASKITSLWIGAVALLIISIIIFYFYRVVSNSNKVIRIQNTEIQKYNTSIDSTLKQKEILLKEVHHRVKNNLQIIASLLNLQMNRIENKLAKEAVSQSRNRVQAIALMHKGLYLDEHYNKVNLETYLNELISQQKLLSIVGNTEISFQLNVQPILLNIDNAVPIGLILSELISNSVKHGFNSKVDAPTIEISVAQIKEQVIVSFKDNGVGLAEDFVIEESESLGFEIITALTEQINGEIKVHSKKPLEIELKF
ncbi:MAG: two-component sensor histidine kinase [bacterium]|jgi:two-component sensor histidine kinase